MLRRKGRFISTHIQNQGHANVRMPEQSQLPTNVLCLRISVVYFWCFVCFLKKGAREIVSAVEKGRFHFVGSAESFCKSKRNSLQFL